jgi:hypothetical protein
VPSAARDAGAVDNDNQSTRAGNPEVVVIINASEPKSAMPSVLPTISETSALSKRSAFEIG